MTTPFKANDSRQVALLGNKPLAITWGRRGISWNALQMWNASVVLFDPQQDEQDIRTVNNMLYKDDYAVKRANRDKWVRQIIDAHVKGTGFRAFQDGDTTAWPKIQRSDVSTITVLELTNVLLAHRQQVRAWALARTRKPVTPVEAPVEPPVEAPVEPPVEPVVAIEPLQPDEVPDCWDE